MRSARSFRSSKLAIVAGLGIAGMISSATPAFATTLAVTSLDCDVFHGGLHCTAYVSGGTGGYTYTWNQGRLATAYPDHTTVTIDCRVASTTVAIFVSDSSGATASKTEIVTCSAGT